MMMLCLLTMVATAQTSKEARQWLKKSEWSALKKAKPHKTLNVDEFCRQYQKNKEQWDVLYRWLCETDLMAIPAGKHPFQALRWWPVWRTRRTDLLRSVERKVTARR